MPIPLVSAYNMLVYRLNCAPTGPIFWDNGQLYGALHDAQYECMARTQDYAYGTANLSLSAGDDIVALPWTTIAIPKTITTPEGHTVWPVELAALEDWSANWRTAARGKPQFLIQWDWNHVRVWPKPDANYTYVVGGVPWPTEIVDSSTFVSGLWLQEAVVSFAASRLLAFTQPELAALERQQGEEYLRRFKQNQRKQGGWNTLRLRPGTGWSLSPGGQIGQGRKYS